VLVVTDVRLYLEGLSHSLGTRAELAVAGTASTSQEALGLVRRLAPPPEVVLLDMTMPDSLNTARALLSAAPDVQVVAFGVSERDDDVLACAEAGVSGYVTRSGSCEQLIAVLQSAARGELLCSPRIAARLFRRAGDAGQPTEQLRSRLTTREADVVRLVARGLSNKEVASALQIEVSTVKNHVHNVLAKLQLDSRAKIGALMQASGAMVPSEVR
jgi:DNA-binding NarL/FixJ family response regulator